ncbi:glycosyltransferase family 1 protein [Sulfuricurvum sp. IAE1]|nr:glycosyltransferase family 1 protein [Sulfuricurvum sp. IAE1]
MNMKVLLYLPFESHFYHGLYLQMKKGFEQAGCTVRGGCGFLDGEDLLRVIDEFRPDFVLEMNRVKTDIENFPSDLLHICWLVDYWERTPAELCGSDFLYLFSHVWLKDHPMFTGKHMDVLHPGTDPDLYRPLHPNNSGKATIFLGHMPKPWLETELERRVTGSGGAVFRFEQLKKLVHEFTLNPQDFNDGTIATGKYLLHRLGVDFLDTLSDTVLHYDVYARSFREGRRQGVVEKVLNSHLDLHLYGNDSWALRERFRPHYRGMLETPEEINRAFNQSAFLLHDGNMPHFRVFDAMAAGLPVLKPDTSGYGIEDEWDFLDFEEGSEILTYSLDSEELTSIKHLDARRIGDMHARIREKIVKAHTWAHRAEKILGDIAAYAKRGD